jgi:hypothetical protein
VMKKLVRWVIVLDDRQHHQQTHQGTATVSTLLRRRRSLARRLAGERREEYREARSANGGGEHRCQAERAAIPGRHPSLFQGAAGECSESRERNRRAHAQQAGHGEQQQRDAVVNASEGQCSTRRRKPRFTTAKEPRPETRRTRRYG